MQPRKLQFVQDKAVEMNHSKIVQRFIHSEFLQLVEFSILHVFQNAPVRKNYVFTENDKYFEYAANIKITTPLPSLNPISCFE